MEPESSKKVPIIGIICYVLGIIAMLLGLLMILTVWLSIIGAPFYLAGIVLIVVSGFSTKVKVITTVVPTVLIIAAWVGFLTYSVHEANRVTQKTYLIPEGFVGKIGIVYSQPCGQKLEVNDDGNVYKIPDNGLLILQDDAEGTATESKYYYANKQWVKGEELVAYSSEQAYDTGFLSKQLSLKKMQIMYAGFQPESFDDSGRVLNVGHDRIFVLPSDSLEAATRTWYDSVIVKKVAECGGIK